MLQKVTFLASTAEKSHDSQGNNDSSSSDEEDANRRKAAGLGKVSCSKDPLVFMLLLTKIFRPWLRLQHSFTLKVIRRQIWRKNLRWEVWGQNWAWLVHLGQRRQISKSLYSDESQKTHHPVEGFQVSFQLILTNWTLDFSCWENYAKVWTQRRNRPR